MSKDKAAQGAGTGIPGVVAGGARNPILSEDRLRFAARYMPAEFRGDWDPLWGHPLDRRAGDELLEEVPAKR